MAKHIAVYGGSFDPPHLGHINVAKQVLCEVSVLDELWLLPVGMHPWDKCVASAEDRYAMVSCVAQNTPKVRSNSFETQKAEKSYTIETISYFRQNTPNTTWYLVIGSDTAQTFHQWKRHSDLLRLVTLIIVPRAGFTLPNNLSTQSIIIKDKKQTIPPLASSKLRKAVKDKTPVLDTLTHPCVAEYIRSHKLYL